MKYMMRPNQNTLGKVVYIINMNYLINNINVGTSKEEQMLNSLTHPNNFRKRKSYYTSHMKNYKVNMNLNYHKIEAHIHSFQIHLLFYWLVYMRCKKLMRCI